MSDKTAPANITEKDRNDKNSVSEPSLNLDEIRELADLVNEYGFTDFKFENEKIKVRLSKQVAQTFVQPQAMPATPVPAAQPIQSAVAPESSVSASVEEDLYTIKSPIVGTFYSAPGPDKDLYVSVGSKVTPETVVCIVEAMKLMNEIQAETTGEVVKIFVENGQPIEYGQPLFGIRK